MQKSASLPRWRALAAAAAIAAAIWARALLWQAIVQLFFGMLVALAALPVMRRLEKRFSAGVAASLSMMSLSATLIASILLLAPTLIQQGKQLIALLPTLYASAEAIVQNIQSWLAQNGLVFDEQMKSSLLGRGEELLGTAVPSVMAWFSGIAGGIGKWMLAPVFGFYFLRDRRRIGEWLLSLVPVGSRGMTVQILKEMRRETAGYVRGQLMVSAVVGGLTAIGLLFCGIPAWLVLGAIMGVLELIPYVGPFLGGVLVVLFSLPSGLGRTLWALGVVILVQQLEGGMLSPQLMSDATRLHPVAVVLCVMLGGAAGGMGGILLSVPLLLCIRAALRVVSLCGGVDGNEGK